MADFSLKNRVEWLKVLFLLLSALLLPLDVFAVEGGEVIGDALCHIYTTMIGSTGRVISSLAVVFFCFGAFLGKSSWGVAAVVTISIAGALSAHNIVNFVMAGTGTSIIEPMCPGL